jgi:hypothetical protein
MAARILNYVYVGIELSVVPIFQSEIGEQQHICFISYSILRQGCSSGSSSWLDCRNLST